MTILRQGSTGSDVLTLQKQLNQINKGVAGYKPLDEDGVYGVNTAAAVKSFQAANKLDPDSEYGPLTSAALQKKLGPVTTVPTASTPAATAKATSIPAATKPAVGTPTSVSGIGSMTIPTKQVTMYTAKGDAFQIPETDVEQAKKDGYLTAAPMNLSSLSGFTSGAPASGMSAVYKSPYEDKINALLDKYLSYDPNAPINVESLPGYAAEKTQYENLGQSAFNNNIGSLAALTGGRPSTAAVGVATGARNNYLSNFESNVVPGMISQEQTRRQNTMNNIFNQLQELQGLDTSAYNRSQDLVSQTGQLPNGQYTQAGQINQQTILANKAATDAAAHYNDIQGYINTLDPNDPVIPYLQAERQKKVDALKAIKTAADQKAYDDALEKWKITGVVTPEISKILGISESTRTANYNVDLMNANTSRMNASTSRMNANTSAASVNKQNTEDAEYKGWYQKMMSSSDPAAYLSDNKALMSPNVYSKLSGMVKPNSATTSTVDDYAATINSIYVTRPDVKNGIQGSIDREGIRGYLDDLIRSGVDDGIINSLAARYGIKSEEKK